MPELEIRKITGEVERLVLTKSLPVAIGRHSMNEICIDESDVAALHCRISWNKTAFEVTAAGRDGVELNGTPVRHANLSFGDVVRIGSVDIVLVPDIAKAEEHVAPLIDSGEVELKPLSEDELAARSPASAGGPTPGSGSSRPPKISRPSPRTTVPPPAAVDDEHGIVLGRDGSLVSASAAPPEPEAWRERLRGRAVRPGEQDVLRSPLVLTLGGGTAVLLLSALTLWFLIGRETVHRKFERAVSDLEGKKYSQAIEEFNTFLKEYPHHKLAPSAKASLGFAQIEQSISGATPAWQRGLTAVQDFARDNRNHPEFSGFLPRLRQYAEQIALGAAESAAAAKQRPLLAVSAEGTKLLTAYSPESKPAPKVLEKIQEAIRRAEAVILKQETLDAALADIDRALTGKQPLAAIEARRRLLDRYADLATDRAVKDRLDQTLELERQSVVRETPEPVTPAAANPSEAGSPLTLARHTRARSDLASAGTNVFAIAEGCCFAVDSVTGNPQWRRVVGLDPPFFPVPVSAEVLAVLIFDTRTRELLMLRQSSGELIWRQPLDGTASGPPLIQAGQIYLAAGKKLCQLDLVTGRINAMLTFSQPILSPPALVESGDRLAVAGRQALLYTLGQRPLACLHVSLVGHAPGAVQAPLTKLGNYLLVAENDRQESCRLGVWDASDEKHALRLLQTVRVPGEVRDAPVIRGRDLLIPSSLERISAFTVSADKEQRPLAPVASFQVEKPQGGPLHLAAGPNDEFWMVGRSLRRFKLAPDNIVPVAGELPVGICTQPLRAIEQTLYTAGQSPSSRAVSFTAADRQQMAGQWRVILGARVLELAGPASGDGPAYAATDTGDLYALSRNKLQIGGFEARPSLTLKLPESLTEPPHATRLADDRIAFFCGAPEPRLWILSAEGKVEKEFKLAAPLQAAPVALAGGFLLPLPGKLSLAGGSVGGQPVADFLAPVGQDSAATWRLIAARNDKEFVAVTDAGRVSRFQIRAEPLPHLFQVAQRELESPVDQIPSANAERLFVATGSTVRQIDSDTLETRAERPLSAPASQPLWLVGPDLFVVTGREQLTCFDSEHQLQPRWQLPLSGTALAGCPLLWQDKLVVALQDGQILLVAPTDGTVLKRLPGEQPIVLGPSLLHDLVVVATIDGSLQVLNSRLEKGE
jgi:pSer/pThr/pTyr-binding forkhead associated (FHA) protein